MLSIVSHDSVPGIVSLIDSFDGDGLDAIIGGGI